MLDHSHRKFKVIVVRYVHNHRTVNNSLAGNCSSIAWQNGPEKESVAVFMKEQGNYKISFLNMLFIILGYVTAYGGKYLNMYGYDEAGGMAHVPPGWDQ